MFILHHCDPYYDAHVIYACKFILFPIFENLLPEWLSKFQWFSHAQDYVHVNQSNYF